MSSALMSLKRLPKSEYPDCAVPLPPLVASLSIGIPSTTIRALLLPVSELSPLIQSYSKRLQNLNQW